MIYYNSYLLDGSVFLFESLDENKREKKLELILNVVEDVEHEGDYYLHIIDIESYTIEKFPINASYISKENMSSIAFRYVSGALDLFEDLKVSK
jgi:hypothetical protein